MALATEDRLAGTLGLTAPDFGLTPEEYLLRIEIWEQLAAERREASQVQQGAHIRVLALTAAIAHLLRQADKFRAEGDITTERDILGRVEILRGYQAEARAEAGLTAGAQAGGRPAANPAPEIEAWGIV